MTFRQEAIMCMYFNIILFEIVESFSVIFLVGAIIASIIVAIEMFLESRGAR